MFKYFFLALTFLVSAAQAQTWVQVNGFSVHDRPGYNDFNWGGGLEQAVTDRTSVAAGWYRNSEYSGSAYAYGRYSIYKQHRWDVGIALGAVTGYQRASVLPMAFPEVCYGWVCSLFVPQVDANGASALAVRLRIPVR